MQTNTLGALALPRRELQILTLLCAGLRTSAIAEHLQISPKTVSTYRNRLLVKTKSLNNTQLGIWAERNGVSADITIGGESK